MPVFIELFIINVLYMWLKNSFAICWCHNHKLWKNSDLNGSVKCVVFVTKIDSCRNLFTHRIAGTVNLMFSFISEEAQELPAQLSEKASAGVVTPNNLPPVVGLPSQEKAASSTRLKYRSE